MKAERVKELLPILAAFAEGKIIQCKTADGRWHDVKDPQFDNSEYRIKPEEPKFLIPREIWVNGMLAWGFKRENSTRFLECPEGYRVVPIGGYEDKFKNACSKIVSLDYKNFDRDFACAFAEAQKIAHDAFGDPPIMDSDPDVALWLKAKEKHLLPKLPPLPEGYKKWVFRGTRFHSKHAVMYAYFERGFYWWQLGHPAVTGGGDGFYLEAVK